MVNSQTNRSYSRTPAGRRNEIRARLSRASLTRSGRTATLSWVLIAVAVIVTGSGLPRAGLLLWAGTAALLALLELAQGRRRDSADSPEANTIRSQAATALSAVSGLVWCGLEIWAARVAGPETITITTLLLCCAMVVAVSARSERPWAAELHIGCTAFPALPVLLMHPVPQVRAVGILLLVCAVGTLFATRALVGLRRRNLEEDLHNAELTELIEQLHARASTPSAPATEDIDRPRPSPPADVERAPSPGGDRDNRTILSAIDEGILITDGQGRVRYLNPAAQDLCGWGEEAVGRPLWEVLTLIDGPDERALRRAVEAATETNAHTAFDDEARLRHRASRRQISVRISVRPRPVPAEDSGGVIVNLRDITELRSLARFAEFQTTHDPLTGLINWREFVRRLEASMQQLARSGESGAVCYLGLDDVDTVNDACGHPAGDQLLREVAAKLQRQVTQRDTLARIGGGQFAALLLDRHGDQARETGDALRTVVRQIRFPWDDRIFEVSASVGIVLIGRRQSHYTEVMSAARAALALARQQGGNRVHVYTPADQDFAVHHDLGRWMQRVQHAIEQGRFQLLVQPIEPLLAGDGRRSHGELLVRLLDEHGELVAPHSFLRAAERYNLMPAVDRWVIRNSLAALARGADALSGIDRYAINLSGQSLSDPDFLGFVTDCIERTAVDPARLCFEITETAIIQNLGTAQRFMAALRGLGCHFSLDDFGSGLSSYGYLKNLSANYLKIDGSFVRGMVTDPTDRALVASINQVGHMLGMQTIAEHAESAEIVTILRELGVDYAQGEAIGEPRPVQ